MVEHVKGKRKGAHFKSLSAIDILLPDEPTRQQRSMLVTYWTNKDMKCLNLAEELRSYLIS